MSKSKVADLKFDPPPETCCGDGSGCVLDCVWPGKREPLLWEGDGA